MRFYAGQNKIDVPDDASVNVTVGIGPREDLGFGLDVKIKVTLPGVEAAVAEETLLQVATRSAPTATPPAAALDITPELA
ncbi:hypothetical protein [Roseobacter sp.]|uniref:hypothetical protein n=1 Tax=Roseobacter sp. TaxID=1907202 RepID=UPI002966CD36|nr:hypothetical protein [Roseobacter sp.]MDW3181409.1 hypothetical protein [Roseobacter sp.]